MTGEEISGIAFYSPTVAAVALSNRVASFSERVTSRVERGDRERGATLVEYGLLLVLVFLAAFFSIALFGDSIIAVFDSTSDTLDNAPNNNSN